MSNEGANNRQVAGNHYRAGAGQCPHCGNKLQHWDIVTMFGMGYLIGNATKYLFRFRDKGNPLADLEKAIHYIEKQRDVILKENEELIPRTKDDDTCQCSECVQRRDRMRDPMQEEREAPPRRP